jgi:glycosyltransferase involved in cell wall biosynthesis
LNTEPKISIITACYNHGRFIKEMLESVFNQTFTDYEVIVVNDGSTDNTAEILNTVTHEKVKIIHTENRGPALARNTAIELAKSPVIMNLDADDKIAPGLLEKAYTVFCSNLNVGIVHFDAECFGAKSGKFEIGEYSLESMLYDNRINSQSLFRKQDWRTVGGYSPELIYGLEDWDFWLRIIEMGRDIIKIPETLVFYRTYKDQTECRSGRRKSDRRKMMESQLHVFHRNIKLYSLYPNAYAHFVNLERKFESENVMVGLMKSLFYQLRQKYFS